jgi:hypothetical protein
MALLKNTTIDDTGFLRYPIGTTEQRPSSPLAGMIRFNTSINNLEYYNGTSWITSSASQGTLGSSPQLAATSGNQIYSENPNAPTGIYWLKTPSNVTYQAYIKMDFGGGWVNLNTQVGPYSSALTSTWGSGGGNALSGAVVGFGGAITPISANFVANNQGNIFGCPGANGASNVNMNSTLKSDLGATKVRWKFSVQNMSNVTCGFPADAVSNLTIISGTSNNFAVCANPPNQYSQVNPGSFTAEGYGNFSGTLVNRVYTACSGYFEVRLVELYVR